MQFHKPFPKFIPRRLVVLSVTFFLALWLTGMTAALSAGLCRNPDKSPEKRLRGCNISIPLGNLFPGEGPKRASLYLERGILLANMGEANQARADMRKALDRATEGNPHRATQIWADSVRQEQETTRDKGTGPYRPNPGIWLAELFARIQAEPAGSPAKRIWAEVVIKAEGG